MCKASTGHRGHVQISAARNPCSLSWRPDRHAKGSAVPIGLLPGIGRLLRREFTRTIANRTRHRRRDKIVHRSEARQTERAVIRMMTLISSRAVVNRARNFVVLAIG